MKKSKMSEELRDIYQYMLNKSKEQQHEAIQAVCYMAALERIKVIKKVV